jgi:hypothetical protein
MDLKVDEFLLRHRAPLSLRQLLERYQRSLPTAGETLVSDLHSPDNESDSTREENL